MKGDLSKFLNLKYKALYEKGWMVVRRAVIEEHIEQILEQFWKDLAQLGTGLTPDPSTHKNERWPQTENGLMQTHSCGHWESAWMCRLACQHIWEDLFCGETVVSSLDGFALCRPVSQHAMHKACKDGVPNWMHRDQKLKNGNLVDSIQGMLALSDVNEADHSTVFWEPVNASMQELLDEFQATFATREDGPDWYPFNAEQYEFFKERCALQKPLLKKGDLLLWTSATPHAACPGSMQASPRTLRIASFVSMMPRKALTPNQLKQRMSLMERHLTTTHNVKHPKLFAYLRHNSYVTYAKPLLPSYKQFIDEDFEKKRKLIGYA